MQLNCKEHTIDSEALVQSLHGSMATKLHQPESDMSDPITGTPDNGKEFRQY